MAFAPPYRAAAVEAIRRAGARPRVILLYCDFDSSAFFV
jgi:hypothetical protein